MPNSNRHCWKQVGLYLCLYLYLGLYLCLYVYLGLYFYCIALCVRGGLGQPDWSHLFLVRRGPGHRCSSQPLATFELPANTIATKLKNTEIQSMWITARVLSAIAHEQVACTFENLCNTGKLVQCIASCTWSSVLQSCTWSSVLQCTWSSVLQIVWPIRKGSTGQAKCVSRIIQFTELRCCFVFPCYM